MEGLFAPGANQGALVGRLYGLMTRAMAPVARYLTTLPISDGVHAGASFQRYDFDGDAESETLELAEAVAKAHHELEDVATTLT